MSSKTPYIVGSGLLLAGVAYYFYTKGKASTAVPLAPTVPATTTPAGLPTGAGTAPNAADAAALSKLLSASSSPSLSKQFGFTPDNATADKPIPWYAPTPSGFLGLDPAGSRAYRAAMQGYKASLDAINNADALKVFDAQWTIGRNGVSYDTFIGTIDPEQNVAIVARAWVDYKQGVGGMAFDYVNYYVFKLANLASVKAAMQADPRNWGDLNDWVVVGMPGMTIPA